jgi:hypothetical protein
MTTQVLGQHLTSSTMSPASIAATAPPWADLLPELCHLVTERLDPISILRFPAVCRGWSAACEENPRLRPGAPALLTSGLDTDGCEIESNVDAGAFGLHDVSGADAGGKSFLGEAEGLKGRTWVGGKDGWLVTTDCGCDVELLNPVTGARVRLPSFATIRGVEVPGYLHVRTTRGGHCHKILKVALCRTPAHPDGHLAVALFSQGLLAFTAAGAGDKGEYRWTALKNPTSASRSDVSYMDAIVLDGKLFAVNEVGRIYSWDMDGGATTEPAVVKGPEIDESSGHDNDHDRCGFYLAAASGGGGGQERLLLIYVHGYDVADMYKYRGRCWDSRVWSRLVFDDRRSFLELGMSLHELDAGSGTWRRVADLGGDRALFLGANYPFYVSVRRGRASEDEADLEADCVYLADTPYGCDAAIFDLKVDGYIKQRLAYSLVADPLQMPMWFLPTDYPH